MQTADTDSVVSFTQGLECVKCSADEAQTSLPGLDDLAEVMASFTVTVEPQPPTAPCPVRKRARTPCDDGGEDASCVKLRQSGRTAVLRRQRASTGELAHLVNPVCMLSKSH